VRAIGKSVEEEIRQAMARQMVGERDFRGEHQARRIDSAPGRFVAKIGPRRFVAGTDRVEHAM
jgi:hypothetical protein